MPDAEGNQKADATETPLHAYKDGREEQVEEGSLGRNPDGSRLTEGDDDGGSYQGGGFAGDQPDPAAPERAAALDGAEGKPNVADGALDDTVTHPEAGDEGLGSKTGGVDGPDR